MLALFMRWADFCVRHLLSGQWQGTPLGVAILPANCLFEVGRGNPDLASSLGL